MMSLIDLMAKHPAVSSTPELEMALASLKMLTSEAWDACENTDEAQLVNAGTAEPISVNLTEAGNEVVDQGAHYRYSHTVKLSENDKQVGFVTLNLDPFRIVDIYKITDFAQDTIVKKALCTGIRGHKDFRQDMLDIICAAERRIAMLDEDSRNALPVI